MDVYLGTRRTIPLETIRSVFLPAATQVYIVHHIRNNCKHVVYKDLKAFTKDLRDEVDSLIQEHKMQLKRTTIWNKQYGFVYKSRSADPFVGKIDVTPYEVTHFTDHSTEKYIPSLTE